MRQERKAASLALQKLNVHQLPPENVEATQFLGYFVEDRYSLYSATNFPQQFQGTEPGEVDLKENVTVTLPDSGQAQDMIAVRQNKPLQMVAVSWVGTQHRYGLMPWHIRSGQGKATFNKSADTAQDGRGMTAHMRRTVMGEAELAIKVNNLVKKKKDIELARKLKEKEAEQQGVTKSADDDAENSDSDGEQEPLKGPGSLPDFIMGRKGAIKAKKKGGPTGKKKVLKDLQGKKQSLANSPGFATPQSKVQRSLKSPASSRHASCSGHVGQAQTKKLGGSEGTPLLRDAGATGSLVAKKPSPSERHAHPPSDWLECKDQHLWDYWDVVYGLGDKTQITKVGNFHCQI